MNEFASSGTYYFASGTIMKDAFMKQVEQDLSLNNEYYVSLSYKPLLQEDKKISIYPLQHFMQWGTPEDVHEYNYWSNAFKQILNQKNSKKINLGTLVVPMAGLGQRFVDEGYMLTKPLISVSGKPMFFQAVDSLPDFTDHVFVLREDMPGYKITKKEILKKFPNSIISTVPNVTDGQASSALIGLNEIEKSISGELETPVTFGACDFGAVYNQKILKELNSSNTADIIVWAIKGYPNASKNPTAYGWLECNNGYISNVSVKKPLSSPSSDPIILGAFTFKHSHIFKESVQQLKKNKNSINNEFYIDSCINEAIKLGYKCRIFEVESYLCWGTPNDLKIFNYWQSCFHKWMGHPYNLQNDIFIENTDITSIQLDYSAEVFNKENGL
jgi:dTDP-glucose pyrophosphorylase